MTSKKIYLREFKLTSSLFNKNLSPRGLWRNQMLRKEMNRRMVVKLEICIFKYCLCAFAHSISY
jgi:hypothetical protein